jgi:hypothetical protein
MNPNNLVPEEGYFASRLLSRLRGVLRRRLNGGPRRRAPDSHVVLLFSSLVALSLVLLFAFGPGSVDSRGSPSVLEEGRVAEKDITADREISFVDSNATRLRVEAEARLVLPVFVVDDKPASRAMERFRSFQDLMGDLTSKKVAGETLYLQVQSAFPGLLSKDEVLALSRSPLRSQAFAFADDILRGLLDKGIVAMPASGLEPYNPDYVELHSIADGRPSTSEIPINRVVTLTSLRDAVDAEVSDRRLARPLAALASGMVMSFAVEDAFFDQAQSDHKLASAKAEVEPVIRTIAKGERIVRKGAVVSALDAAKLNAAQLAVSRVDWGAAMGAFCLLVASLFLALFLLGKPVSGSNLRRSSSYLMIITAFVYFATVLFIGRFARPDSLDLAFFLPTALFAMIAAILEGPRFAILFGLVLSSLAQAAVGLDARLLAFCLLSSTAGAFSVRGAFSRIDLVKAGAVLAFFEAAIGAALAAPGASGAGEPFIAAVYGAGNGFSCALLALAILPVLEQALNAPTRFRLMELSDLNAPILKRLLTVAPGTYSHSVTVAHLAESACREIGADPFLARVGAYYHDIGKIEQPEYFVENQSGYNKHDELNPRLSATVIRSHVKLGAEKAKALGLPDAVVDIIAQHHGNSLISWFFDQAKKSGGEVDRDDFSYPGQPPASKEAAVVMLADSVEAATRTLKKPTASRLEDFIRDIIMDKVQSGQLDRCDLTFKDLETIRNSFTRILAGHFHSRIEYPKLKESAR